MSSLREETRSSAHDRLRVPPTPAPPRVKVVPDDAVFNDWQEANELYSLLAPTNLDPWQAEVLEAGLGLLRNGTWAARQVGVSAPRQNGKTQILIARILAGALLFGEKKIIVSAHQQATARETFEKIMEIYDESPALQKRIASVMNALHRESITFTNGCVVQFKARSGPGGRGFSCDCLLLDEAQSLSQRAWTSINSTMSARQNPQVWLLGTPPTPFDDGVVFGRIREAALAGDSTGLAWLEWGADRDDDPAKEYTRWKANPAWTLRVNHKVVQDEFETYDSDDFFRERLGVWDDASTLGPQVFTRPGWNALEAPMADEYDRTAVGVKFSVDGSGIAVVAAHRPIEGPIFIEPIKQANLGEGIDWVVDYLAENHTRLAQIVIDGRAGTGHLVQELQDAGIRNKRIITIPNLTQVKDAHSMFEQAYWSGQISHAGVEAFTEQVLHTTKRHLDKQGGFGWQPMYDDGTVVAVDAATFAYWGVRTTRRRPGRAMTGVTMT